MTRVTDVLVDPETCGAWADSLGAIEWLAQSPATPPRLAGLLNLIRGRKEIYLNMRFTRTADKFATLFFEPTEQYFADVSALVAGNVQQYPIVISWRHGWPILSLESESPSVTEAGQATSLPGGGAK